MLPLAELALPQLSLSKRIWMGVLRTYCPVAVALVAVNVFQIASSQ